MNGMCSLRATGVSNGVSVCVRVSNRVTVSSMASVSNRVMVSQAFELVLALGLV